MKYRQITNPAEPLEVEVPRRFINNASGHKWCEMHAGDFFISMPEMIFDRLFEPVPEPKRERLVLNPKQAKMLKEILEQAPDGKFIALDVVVPEAYERAPAENEQ